MITATDLCKTYEGQEVLRCASFSAAPGCITLLTGSNGAGKTTALRILCGLVRPEKGSACIDGIDVVARRLEAQARLSFLPQDVSFHPAMSPMQVMRFYADLRRVDRSRINDLLEQVDLLSVCNRAVSKLSGGMLQRLGLALLLLPDAPVLILDEPGVSLDPAWRDYLRQALCAEAERNKTVLITSHLLAEWSDCVHETLICREGKILPEASPAMPTNFWVLERMAG